MCTLPNRTTVDEYYAGLNNSIQHASVRHILESTVDSLQKDPNRKFIYVEQAFFQRFYAERTDEEVSEDMDGSAFIFLSLSTN